MTIAKPLRLAQACEGIRGFTGLGHGDDQGIVAHHRVTITKFAGNLDAAGNTGDGFQPVTPDHAGMVTGATGDDVYPGNLIEDAAGVSAEGLFHHPVGSDPAFQGIGNGAWLLIDFLEHVMAEATLVGGINRHPGRLYRTLHHGTAAVVDGHTPEADIRDITIFKEYKLLCTRIAAPQYRKQSTFRRPRYRSPAGCRDVRQSGDPVPPC